MSALRPCGNRLGRSGTTWSSRGASQCLAVRGLAATSAIPVTARAGPAGARLQFLPAPRHARPRPSAIPVAP
eukprot:3417000-Alexandrium_andersonii.AAC.1